jgi:hypothetical protein
VEVLRNALPQLLEDAENSLTADFRVLLDETSFLNIRHKIGIDRVKIAPYF